MELDNLTSLGKDLGVLGKCHQTECAWMRLHRRQHFFADDAVHAPVAINDLSDAKIGRY